MSVEYLYTRILQVNLNRSWTAFDLLKQHVIEFNVGLVAISEPPQGIQSNNRCFVSLNNLAAIIWRPEGSGNKQCYLVNKGNDFVVVKFGDILVISSYISPNIRISSFIDCLDKLCVPIHMTAVPQLFCGDFNARSILWNCPDTNRKGELTERCCNP